MSFFPKFGKYDYTDESPQFEPTGIVNQFSNLGKFGIKPEYKKYVSAFDRAQMTSSPIAGIIGANKTRKRLQYEILEKVNNGLRKEGKPEVTFEDVFDENLMNKGGRTKKYRRQRKSRRSRRCRSSRRSRR